MNDIAKSTLPVFSAVVFATLFSLSSMAAEQAQLSGQIGTKVTDVTEIEIDRGDVELRDTLRPHPDNDFIDTALVFTNRLESETTVYCAAFSANGQVIGRARVRIPGNGLRFITASGIARGLDFIGSARCHSRGKVEPTAFIVEHGLTATKAKAKFDWPGTRMIFPTVVTY